MNVDTALAEPNKSSFMLPDIRFARSGVISSEEMLANLGLEFRLSMELLTVGESLCSRSIRSFVQGWRPKFRSNTAGGTVTVFLAKV